MTTTDQNNGSASSTGGAGSSSSSSNITNQRGVSRVLTKLENSIEQGDYYEAHQMYRTLYFRYTTQKRYKDCLELLYSGALKLLSKQQQGSAVDLSLLIVDTLEKCAADKNSTENNDNDAWIEKLGILICTLHANVVERDTLILRAVKWSANISGNNLGHPKMHKFIAQVFWHERNIEQARHHFLLSQDGEMCGSILAEISESKGFNTEIDLFIVQAVLQQLCLKDAKVAEDTFNSYIKHHKQILRKTRPYKLPLLNFTYFLFRTIELNNLGAFRTLRELYEPSLSRDQSFLKYLCKIGVVYFGETPAPAAGGGLMGGMFGDIFSRILQGFDDDDDNTAERPLNTELD